MKIRYNVIPKTIFDILCIIVIGLSFPVVCYVEAFFVLPAFHEPGTLAHKITLFFGLCLWLGVEMNFLVLLITDTSIKNEAFSSPDNKEDWRFCEKCESYAPPRSWHCIVCKTCILKRDHHSMFTACCIGHRNHRYFMVLLMYMLIACAITTVYDSIYLWWLKYDEYVNIWTILKICFPMLTFSFDTSLFNLFLFNYVNKIVASFQIFSMLKFHWNLVIRGALTYEKDGSKYDLGFWRNIEMVFGRRWQFVWLSPFIASELPADGINWKVE
ncbi:ZDHHC24 family protein [Megaselia abdita]